MIHPRVELHAMINSFFAIPQVQKAAQIAEHRSFRQLMPVLVAILDLPGMICPPGIETTGWSSQLIGLAEFPANC